VRFYVTPLLSFGPIEMNPTPRVRELYAFWHNRLYDLPADLLFLLYDCGLDFSRNEDAQVWARALVILSEGYRGRAVNPNFRRVDEGLPRVDSVPIFPALTIDRLTIDVATGFREPHRSIWRGYVREVSVDYHVDGMLKTARIETEVWSDGEGGLVVYPQGGDGVSCPKPLSQVAAARKSYRAKQGK